MSFAAVAAAVVGAGASYGISAAASPGQPQYPNEAASTAALQNLNAKELPTWLAEEAAAQKGTSVNVPAQGTHPVQVQVGTNPSTGKPIFETQNVPNTGTQTVDFQGLGTADIEAAQAQQAAQQQVQLAQEYDPQFIAQSLAEEQQANPQGAAARTEENNLIQQEVSNPVQNPVANQLNQQISQQISAAANNTMTPAEEAQFAQNVAQATAQRGSGGSTAAFEQPIVTGASGLARQQAAAGAGTSWLSSGQTPADFAYRQQQQAMSDLSSMVNGATPESQFKQLSGAQTGPTPEVSATLSQLPNQPNAAIQAGIQSTNTQMQSALGQANPWSLGLSSALNLGSAIAKLPGAG